MLARTRIKARAVLASSITASMAATYAAPRAHADPVPPAGVPPGAVPVVVEAKSFAPDIFIEADPPRAVPPLVCHGSCTVYLYPGRYRFTAEETDATREGDRAFDVTDPSSVTVTPGWKGKRLTGTLLGYSGIASIIAGLVVIGAAENGHASKVRKRDETIGGLLMFGGLASGITGLVLALSTRTKVTLAHYTASAAWLGRPSERSWATALPNGALLAIDL